MKAFPLPPGTTRWDGVKAFLLIVLGILAGAFDGWGSGL